MSSRRIRLRPPGVKPWTRIGPLGPFRGRLGIAWVVAPIVLGVILVAVAWPLLFARGGPGPQFREVGPVAGFAEGRARATALPGVFVGRRGGQFYAVRQDPACPLSAVGAGYTDCRGARYSLAGDAVEGRGRLEPLPVAVYREGVYVDPSGTGDGAR